MLQASKKLFLFNILFFAKNNKKAHPKAKAFFKKLKSYASWKETAGKIFLIYFLILMLGAFLLCIPGVVHRHSTIDGRSVSYAWNFLLSLFNASSAFSDTGLSIPSASQDYSIWGQVIIAVLIQLGGFGVLAFKVILWTLLGLKIKLKDLFLAYDERGGHSVASTLKILKISFLFLILIEIFGAVILFIIFYFSGAKPGTKEVYVTYHNFGHALWSGIFHSISAINNAGFDIIGKNSLLNYESNYGIQFIFLIEFIIGGIGFPTFYDLYRTKFGFDKSKKLTTFTKLNLITYGSISVIGASAVCAIEYGSSSSLILKEHHGFNGFMAIFFNTMSTRNAGFSTVDVSQFLNGSKIVHSILMFIGSAPSSTAGGIRTTTLAVLILLVVSTIRQKKHVNVFKKRIPSATTKLAGVVIFVATILVGFTTFIISATNYTYNPLNVFYTVCSAFGTTGLNALGTWKTYSMGAFNILLMSALMFIGQMGVSSTLLAWSKRQIKADAFAYPSENVRIG